MSQDVYDGSWDWERIYLDCHAADRVADNVFALMGRRYGRLFFAGFPNVASDLARNNVLTFVDRSEAIVSSTIERYSNIAQTVNGDVLSVLHRDRADRIVISGRMTTFWKGSDFQRIQSAILAHPRRRILIDFFDATAVSVGQTFTFGRPPATGTWRVLNVQKHEEPNSPAAFSVTQDVSYDLDETNLNYVVDRFFYDADDIAEWAETALPGFDVLIRTSLLPDDPSFTLDLRAREWKRASAPRRLVRYVRRMARSFATRLAH